MGNYVSVMVCISKEVNKSIGMWNKRRHTHTCTPKQRLDERRDQSHTGHLFIRRWMGLFLPCTLIWFLSSIGARDVVQLCGFKLKRAGFKAESWRVILIKLWRELKRGTLTVRWGRRMEALFVFFGLEVKNYCRNRIQIGFSSHVAVLFVIWLFKMSAAVWIAYQKH